MSGLSTGSPLQIEGRMQVVYRVYSYLITLPQLETSVQDSRVH